MKELSKTFTYLSDTFRVTKHFSPDLIEIEVWRERKPLFGKDTGDWVRTYFGHIEPIQTVLDFYKINL